MMDLEKYSQATLCVVVVLCALSFAVDQSANTYLEWKERSGNVVDREEVEYQLSRIWDAIDSMNTEARIHHAACDGHDNRSEHRWREMYQRHGMRWPSATGGLGESQPNPSEGMEGPNAEVDH